MVLEENEEMIEFHRIRDLRLPVVMVVVVVAGDTQCTRCLVR